MRVEKGAWMFGTSPMPNIKICYWYVRNTLGELLFVNLLLPTFTEGFGGVFKLAPSLSAHIYNSEDALI